MHRSKDESSTRPNPPNTVGSSRKPTTPINDIVGLIEAATPNEGTVTAYVCSGDECRGHYSTASLTQSCSVHMSLRTVYLC